MQKIKITLVTLLFLQVICINSQGPIIEVELSNKTGAPEATLYNYNGYFTKDIVVAFNTNNKDSKYPKGYYYWNGTDWIPAYNQKPKGSFKGDLEALYAIQNAVTNTGKTAYRPWDIDLENIDNPKNYNLSGVGVAEVNGENRVVCLNFLNFRFEDITIEKGLEAAIFMNIYDNNIKSLSLTLPNLITLLIYDNNPGLLKLHSQLSKINLKLENAKALMIERVDCIRELNIDTPNVTTLFYTSNGCVGTLDLNKMTSLKRAILEYNNFSDLKVNECKLLEEVVINNSRIESLDFSNNPKLTKLAIYKRDTPKAEVRLKSLNISKNINLKRLHLRSVYLPSIDISNNVNLEYFHDRYSDYEKLDLTKNKKLKTLILIRNFNVSTIDLSNSNDIREVVLTDNMIDQLNLKNCSKLTDVSIDYSDKIDSLDLSLAKNLSYLSYHFASSLKGIKMCKETPYLKESSSAEYSISSGFYTLVDCK